MNRYELVYTVDGIMTQEVLYANSFVNAKTLIDLKYKGSNVVLINYKQY